MPAAGDVFDLLIGLHFKGRQFGEIVIIKFVIAWYFFIRKPG